MKVNLANLLRQASRAIDPNRDRGAYAFMLDEVAGHIVDVREGRHTLEEFADFYQLHPSTSASNRFPATTPEPETTPFEGRGEGTRHG